MRAVALSNPDITITDRYAWRIVLLVVLLHVISVAVFRYGLPDWNPKRISEITIELSAALPRGEGGDGVRQVAQPVREPVQKKSAVQDENSTKKAVEAPKQAEATPSASSAAAGVESAPTVDADYKAAYLNNPKPPYPPVAFQMRIEGTVSLKVLVLPDGQVGEVLLGRSSGNSLLDQSALNTVAKWKFVPAKSQGKDISQWISVPITFSLKRR